MVYTVWAAYGSISGEDAEPEGHFEGVTLLGMFYFYDGTWRLKETKIKDRL